MKPKPDPAYQSAQGQLFDAGPALVDFIDMKNSMVRLATCLNPMKSSSAAAKAIRAVFLSEVNARPEPSIVVSREGFQNIIDLSRVKAFFDQFNVVVVGYLREALIWKQSAWAQRIHAQCYTDPFISNAMQNRLNYPEFCKR